MGVAMQILKPATILLTLAGCVENPVVPPKGEVTPIPAPSCAADGLNDLIGKSAKVLETMRFGAEVRILYPDSMMTLDYNPARTNIFTSITGG
jgi:hypothetical protein